MKIITIPLDQLGTDDKFRLSFPLRTEQYEALREKLRPMPLIVIDGDNCIVFGIDYYDLLKSRGVSDVQVFQANLTPLDGLVLNYNLKDKYTGLNLYEKLVFIKKLLSLTPQPKTEEIYQRTDLDIAINRRLTEKLDSLLSDEFAEVLKEEKIPLKTGLKLHDFLPPDRTSLLELFSQAPFTSSQQLKIMEMTEELVFKEKRPLAEIFEALALPSYLESPKPQKKIIDAIFVYRNPLYAEQENKWEQDVETLKLPGNFRVTHYPFFEKRQMELTVQVRDADALKELIERIKSAMPG